MSTIFMDRGDCRPGRTQTDESGNAVEQTAAKTRLTMHNRHWTSLAVLLLLLLFAGAADGLMDKLGPVGFMVVGAAVMGAAWALTRVPVSAAAKGAGSANPQTQKINH